MNDSKWEKGWQGYPIVFSMLIIIFALSESLFSLLCQSYFHIKLFICSYSLKLNIRMHARIHKMERWRQHSTHMHYLLPNVYCYYIKTIYPVYLHQITLNTKGAAGLADVLHSQW